MKNRVLALPIMLLLSYCTFSQGIGVGTTNPDASASLDITSNSKGLLIPRMGITGINAIVNPAKGLMVYDSIANQLMVNIGTPVLPNWRPVGGSSVDAWSLNGNTGIDPFNQFIGTIDSKPLRFKVNTAPVGELNPETANIFWGLAAGRISTTGTNNIAIGTNALHFNLAKSFLVAIGDSALLHNGESITFDGAAIGNTAIGSKSLLSNTTGFNNTAVGINSLSFNTTGNANTAFGLDALLNNNTGSFNTMIGANADANQNGLNNATAIGAGATVNASNKVRIGNSSVTVIEGQVPFTTPSDGRYKFNIREDVKGLAFIMKLHPVTYQFDVRRFDGQWKKSTLGINDVVMASYNEAAAIRRTGFIAQEVETAADAAGYNFSGIVKPKTSQDHYSLSYESFVVPLVKAVQEQQEMIEALTKQNADQKNLIEDILKRVERLESSAAKK